MLLGLGIREGERDCGVALKFTFCELSFDFAFGSHNIMTGDSFFRKGLFYFTWWCYNIMTVESKIYDREVTFLERIICEGSLFYGNTLLRYIGSVICKCYFIGTLTTHNSKTYISLKSKWDAVVSIYVLCLKLM